MEFILIYHVSYDTGGSVGTSAPGRRKPRRAPYPQPQMFYFYFFCIFNYFLFIQKNNYVRFTQTSELCLSLLCIKDVTVLSRHSAAKAIKHSCKFTNCFIGHQILNFERSLSLFPGPQSSLVRLVNLFLETLVIIYTYTYILKCTLY